MRKDKLNKEENRKREPFFQRVGVFVTKRYKTILITWLVVVASLIYPTLQLGKVLSYNEMEFLPDNLEYLEGQEIFEQQFPTNASGNTIIVMETDTSITSEQNLEYIRTLTERIEGNFSDDIYEITSVVSIFDSYNESYWSKVTEILDIYYDILLANISYANQEMNFATTEFQNSFNQISGLYSELWFNISRTVFYGLYNTTLFDTGPNATVYQIISDFTNYSTNCAINSPFVDIVHTLINSSIPNTTYLNDSLIHDVTLQRTNTSLFEILNLTTGISLQNYTQTIYPLVDIYHQNWTNTFESLLTANDTSIINGTIFSENLYENSTLNDAYSSQEDVLSRLAIINQTIFNNLSIKNLVVQEALTLFDFSAFYESAATTIGLTSAEIEEMFAPYIRPLMEAIYDLGENPSNEDILDLADIIIDTITSEIVTLQPPPETIEDVPFLLTKWVLSEDKTVSLILIKYDSYGKTSSEVDELIIEIDREIGNMAHELAEELNLDQTRIYHTGDDYVMETWILQAEHDAKRIDIFTIVFVLIILLIIFTSLIAPLIPLIAIGSSIAISMAILWFISFKMEIHFMATLFLTVTSLGAGVDYCIFIFSRYNEERKNGRSKTEAIQIAVKYAGESVFHSGLTVMVGFGALIIPNFPLLRILGISMCIGITISIISAILVVPSIIMLIGDAIWWPKFLQVVLRPQKWFKRKKTEEQAVKSEEVPEGTSIFKEKTDDEKKPEKKKFILRFANAVTKNGLAITIISIVVVAPFVYYGVTMDTSADMLGMLPADFEGAVGRDILSESLSIGDPTSLNIIFHNLDDNPINTTVLFHTAILCDELVKFSKDYDDLANIKAIRTTVQPLGIKIPSSNPDAIDFYWGFIEPYIGLDNRTFYMELYLEKSPYDSSTEQLVDELPTFIEETINDRGLTTLDDSEVYFTGLAQGLYEIKKITDDSLPIVIPVVIIGVYIVLFILFGSYLTPIRLILTIAVSIAFTLGTLTFIFSFGFNAPIFWLLPIMLFSILMGLGLDYDIFLVTRIKEYYDKGMSNKEAIAHALDHTATIITSCGALMAAAYSTLMISQLWHLRELGFAFALAIILDATVIRLVIVPAIMVLMEKYNWLGPKWLMKRRHHCETDEPKAEICETTEK